MVDCGVHTAARIGMLENPEANFYLTHPFLDLVSARSANWQTAHVQVGGVQPLNLEAN